MSAGDVLHRLNHAPCWKDDLDIMEFSGELRCPLAWWNLETTKRYMLDLFSTVVGMGMSSFLGLQKCHTTAATQESPPFFLAVNRHLWMPWDEKTAKVRYAQGIADFLAFLRKYGWRRERDENNRFRVLKL